MSEPTIAADDYEWHDMGDGSKQRRLRPEEVHARKVKEAARFAEQLGRPVDLDETLGGTRHDALVAEWEAKMGRPYYTRLSDHMAPRLSKILGREITTEDAEANGLALLSECRARREVGGL